MAIVGKNGVGKSTLLKSFLKLRPLRAGDISIDGVSIGDIDDGAFRDLVGFVPQDTHLFNESVMYNIMYGSPKVFEEDVYRLSKALGLHESIMGLESGYQTCVGEQGSSLSGGERQKIVILRALIRECPILVMDEPTAALDKKAEGKILEQIMRYDGLTVLAIVHNLEILKIFDRILLVEKAGVREIAGLDELSIEAWMPAE